MCCPDAYLLLSTKLSQTLAFNLIRDAKCDGLDTVRCVNNVFLRVALAETENPPNQSTAVPAIDTTRHITATESIFF